MIWDYIAQLQPCCSTLYLNVLALTFLIVIQSFLPIGDSGMDGYVLPCLHPLPVVFSAIYVSHTLAPSPLVGLPLLGPLNSLHLYQVYVAPSTPPIFHFVSPSLFLSITLPLSFFLPSFFFTHFLLICFLSRFSLYLLPAWSFSSPLFPPSFPFSVPH